MILGIGFLLVVRISMNGENIENNIGPDPWTQIVGDNPWKEEWEKQWEEIKYD